LFKKYILVVSTVNQLVIGQSLISKLALKGSFSVIIFGSRSTGEIRKIAAFAGGINVAVEAELWLPSLSALEAKRQLASLSGRNYSEVFFFSYYTYYSMFIALLQRSEVPCSIVEEGLGTYRVGIEKQVPPLPLGLTIKGQQQTLLALFWRVADWFNQRSSKFFLVTIARLLPFSMGAYLSRPARVHRVICYYPDLLRPYFEADEFIELRFNDRQLRSVNKAYLDGLSLVHKNGVVFASQPILWQMFEAADEVRNFLLELLDGPSEHLLFVPHPRDDPAKLAALEVLIADEAVLSYLDMPEQQDLETIIGYIQPRKVQGISSSTLLYCSQVAECSSVLHRVPANKISPEVAYHDLIYRWIKSHVAEDRTRKSIGCC
jgi:hypothetical protein